MNALVLPATRAVIRAPQISPDASAVRRMGFGVGMHLAAKGDGSDLNVHYILRHITEKELNQTIELVWFNSRIGMTIGWFDIRF